MPITYDELNGPLSIKLDDQFSDRYRPDVRVAAFNVAIRKAASAIGWAMANRKGPEEALRELTYVRMFQTDSEGGVSLSDPTLGHSIWNVLAVYARPLVVRETSPLITPTAPDSSQYRPDLAFSGSGDAVERITLEEVPMRRGNMFLNGNEVLANNPKRVSFAYYIVGDASGGSFNTAGAVLRVIPKTATAKSLIAIAYMAQPTEFTGPSGSVEFPQSFKQTLVEWAAQEISIAQGDGTTLYSTSEKDAAQLFNFIA